MSSVVSSPPSGSFQRFASGFGRGAIAVSVLGLLVAVAMTFVPGWFDLGGADDDGPTYGGLKAAQPVRVAMDGVGVVAPLIASDRDPIDVLTTAPDDLPLVTWWQESAKPGAPKGQTVLAAHADEAGTVGGLAAMGALQPGQFVDVLTRTGTMRYEVTGVHTLNPQRFQKAALGYMKQDGGAGRLVAISAGGWDGSVYQQTTVVTAEPLGQPEE